MKLPVSYSPGSNWSCRGYCACKRDITHHGQPSTTGLIEIAPLGLALLDVHVRIALHALFKSPGIILAWELPLGFIKGARYSLIWPHDYRTGGFSGENRCIQNSCLTIHKNGLFYICWHNFPCKGRENLHINHSKSRTTKAPFSLSKMEDGAIAIIVVAPGRISSWMGLTALYKRTTCHLVQLWVGGWHHCHI